MRFTTGQALSYEENRKQLSSCIASYWKPGNEFWIWAVETDFDSKFVGTCAIVPRENRTEIGYRLLENQFGRGYGQEICDGLINHAIHSMGAKEIVAVADCRNIASVKILDRSILPFVGEKKDAESGGVDRCYHWALNSKETDSTPPIN